MTNWRNTFATKWINILNIKQSLKNQYKRPSIPQEKMRYKMNCKNIKDIFAQNT